MTVSHWQRTAAEVKRINCDVCILGAGITGASAAYWLRRTEPRLRVVVLDARTPGAGASGRNAGMVLAGLSTHYDETIEVYGRDRAREIWRSTLEHQRFLREFLSEQRADVRYEPCGSWRLGLEEAERRHLEQSALLLNEDGFPATFHARDPLDRGFYGALEIESDAGVHPLLLVEALLAASGAEIFNNCEALKLSSEGESVCVHTNSLDVRAGRVLIALNAYAPLFSEHFRTMVEPHRGQVFVTAPLQRRILDRLVYAHFGYIYFRQLADGSFLLGGWRHEYAEREAGYSDETTEEVQGALERFMRARFPETALVPIETRWTGTMGFSRDGLPLVGTLPEDRRVAYAVGFTGHGFGLALEVTRRAVGMMLKDESPGVFAAERLRQPTVTG